MAALSLSSSFSPLRLLIDFSALTVCAGKLPNNLVHERYRKRYNRESFIYSVRFRVGPFGITFDNKVCGCTQRRIDAIAVAMILTATTCFFLTGADHERDDRAEPGARRAGRAVGHQGAGSAHVTNTYVYPIL